MTAWYLLIGLLLVGIVTIGSHIGRLPISTALLYLITGMLIGPWMLGLVSLSPLRDALFIERAAEVAMLLSLFSAGLKLRAPLTDRLWRAPFILATATMLVTVLLLAFAAHFVLDLSWGAAILLGGILAPTDPVLASDVQTRDPGDADPLRFGLTGEAGLNDGTALAVVVLGLGMLGGGGVRDLSKWLIKDVVWAGIGGIAVGHLLGMALARFVLHLRLRHDEAVGADDFLALGLVALSYGTASAVGGNGFLAVFTAGLSLRRIEKNSGERPAADFGGELEEEAATDVSDAPAFLAKAVLRFNEQMERLGEVGGVILVGILLADTDFTFASSVIAVVALGFARPVAVFLTLPRIVELPVRRGFIAWFGMRGIGSLYYLAHSVNSGISDAVLRPLVAAVIATVTLSILVHGISVTPLMNLYELRSRRRWRRRREPVSLV